MLRLLAQRGGSPIRCKGSVRLGEGCANWCAGLLSTRQHFSSSSRRSLRCLSSCGAAGLLRVTRVSLKQRTNATEQPSGKKGAAEEDASAAEGGFLFDPMASVRHDAAVEVARRSHDKIMRSLLPAGAPPAAVEKVRQYLQQHPVDLLITQPRVQITHIEDPEKNADVKITLSSCELGEALSQAAERGMNLVQMGSKEDLAFCRIRHERPWIEKLIVEDMKATEAGDDAGAGATEAPHAEREPPSKPKRLVHHQFRDVVDAHFVGWRSKKVCEDIKRGHPVMLVIKEFQSPESAVHKLREMCQAVKKHAESQHIYHHFTSIVANDREAHITLSPATANKSGTFSKVIKHPTEKEWVNALKRMQDACRRFGRSGTYVKNQQLKPRNVGSTMFRVDKYGRRID